MTNRQKEFLIEQKGSLYFIRLEGGGELPAKLTGQWTSPDIARQFIDKFLRDEEIAKVKAAEKKVGVKKSTQAKNPAQAKTA